MYHKRVNDSVHWFLNDLTARIVAETRIPTDRYHLGKMILQSFKDDPDLIMQIDGVTGESETSSSVRERSIRCAISFKNMGLKKGDVIVLMAPNHVNIAIPIYAALYLGIIVAAVDKTLGPMELRNSFVNTKPRLIFCQSEKVPDIKSALSEAEINSQIITFDDSKVGQNFLDLLQVCNDPAEIQGFRPEDFDPEDTISCLVSTSGTTGLPKAAAITHKNFAITLPTIWARYKTFPKPTDLVLVTAPLQWLTALLHFLMSPIMRYTRLQSSLPLTKELTYQLMNTYKPTSALFSPTVMTSFIKPEDRGRCDFSCLEQVMVGGSSVSLKLLDDMRKLMPRTDIINVYGMSEMSGIAFQTDDAPPGSCGKPAGCLIFRLINVDTQEDILEPHSPGELWAKGPGIFKEYYNNPTATEESFAEDRWFKTGDMFYRDENWNFFFVERLKLLLKYKSYQISPIEVEGVIRQHPGVLDVAVTGIPDPECGELPVACIVRRGSFDVTADEIKDLVKNNLSDAKQLRGGVIFINEMPMTATTKINRAKIKELALLFNTEKIQ